MLSSHTLSLNKGRTQVACKNSRLTSGRLSLSRGLGIYPMWGTCFRRLGHKLHISDTSYTVVMCLHYTSLNDFVNGNLNTKAFTSLPDLDENLHEYRTIHCLHNCGDKLLLSKSSGTYWAHLDTGVSTCPCLGHQLKMNLHPPSWCSKPWKQRSLDHHMGPSQCQLKHAPDQAEVLGRGWCEVLFCGPDK